MPEKAETRPHKGADRASKLHRLAACTSENKPSPNYLQLAYIARRVGTMDPATLAAIASICFGEVAQ